MGVRSNATDGWDSGLDQLHFASTGYAAVYHELDTPEWLGPTGFYYRDLRSPLARKESKTWEPICFWAAPSYADNTMSIAFMPSFPPWPPSDRKYLLELTRVPDGIVSPWPVGTVWELPQQSLFTRAFPTYRTTDGLAGYRFKFTVTEAHPGDLDNDGDVDLDDYEGFATCLTGPNGEPAPGCTPERFDRSDLDDDGDVDLSDFSVFAQYFTGMRASRPEYAGAETCTECHEAYHTDWAGTLHAGAFGRLVEDGEADNPACYPCHTVGFGRSSGFVDMDTTPQLANVQCEACHGPGSHHNADPYNAPVTVDLDSKLCGQCHVSCHGMCGDYYHPHFEQWSTSKHSKALADIFLLPEYDGSCLPCHSTDYRLAPEGDKPLPSKVLFGLECAACHRPYGSENVHQLRLPPEDLCAQCHTMKNAMPGETPDQPQTEVLHGVGGYTLDGGGMPPMYTIPYASIPGQCAGCHVYREDYTGPDQPANSGHTFKSNMHACDLCHDEVDAAARLANIRAEIGQRLAGIVPYLTPGDPLYVNPAALAPDQLSQYNIARFDYELIEADRSFGAHNARFARMLLTEAETFFEHSR